MKFRTGFVSNSSSSSFVCIGRQMKTVDILKIFGDEDPEERAKSVGLDILFDDSIGYVGKELASGDDTEDFSDCTLTLDEFDKTIKMIAGMLKVPIEEIKLYAGTRLC